LQDNSEVAAGEIMIGTQGQVTVQESTGSMLTGNVTNHGSLILDPSDLSIFGNFTLAPDGALVLDVDGTGPGHTSLLDITGFGLFEGTIDFDFINGFAPKMGDSFEFINILGGADFSAAKFEIDGLGPDFLYTEMFSNGSFTLTALNDGVNATATTPEPSSWALLAAPLIALSIAIWRRKLEGSGVPGKVTCTCFSSGYPVNL
jgi:hypothetical protein